MIPPGYKQTEVGVIPEEWEVKQIQNVCRLVNWRGFKPHEWQTTGLPIIRIQNLNGSDDFNYYSGYYDPKILVEHGQLLFAWSGSRGTSFGPHVWNGGRALLNYHTWKVVVHESRVHPDFFFHGLRQLTSYIEDRAHGASALVHTQKWEMEKFPIPIPPLPEQRAIATALSDVDALLAALDRLIAKQRDLKQAAMQQLLTGQTRLPGFTGKWETKRLGDVVDAMVGGGTPSRSNPVFWGDEIPWVTVKDFATFNPRKSQESITKVGLKNSASHLIPAGTLITSTRMALGKAVVYDVDVAINQDLKALFLKPTADRLFVYYWFEANAKVIDDLGSGSTVKGISIAQLKSVPFPGTPLPEQTAIATVLSDMDLELAALEQRRDKTRALKQGMMQELLTGRTRLI
jgi:type I restriction enzyme S subunit